MTDGTAPPGGCSGQRRYADLLGRETDLAPGVFGRIAGTAVAAIEHVPRYGNPASGKRRQPDDVAGCGHESG